MRQHSEAKRRPTMFKLHAILHPTDFSEESESAFRLACALARDHQAKLLVLHVVDPPPIAAAEGALIYPFEEDDAVRERLEAIRPADESVQVEHVLANGNAAEEILEL